MLKRFTVGAFSFFFSLESSICGIFHRHYDTTRIILIKKTFSNEWNVREDGRDGFQS